jgi:hypothetical protein
MATAPVLSNPSVSDIFQEIRQHSPSMVLFRGHDQWWKFEFGARDYWFAPDLGGKPTKHPITGEMVPGDGILRIRDVYGRQQEKLSRKFTGAVGQLEDQTVSAILIFALSEHSDKGVVWLRGDETDEPRRKASRAKVRNHLKAWAEGQIEARTAFVTNFKALPKNAGKRVPPPNDNQRRAQKYLDRLAEEGSEGYEYVCPHGCSDFQEKDDYVRHMRVQHNTDVTNAEPPQAPTPAPLSDAEPTEEELAAAAADTVGRLGAQEPDRLGAAPTGKAKKKGTKSGR